MIPRVFLIFFFHMRHNLLLLNLCFIPGTFCFYKCWHLFQQQQVILFWILSHLKLLELLNSQGQHWVMFLTENSFFLSHLRKIHMNAFLPNDHFIPSHLIMYFFPVSECTCLDSYCRGIEFNLGLVFILNLANDIFSILKVVNIFETAWIFITHVISFHVFVAWFTSHALRLPGVSYWTLNILTLSLL